MGCRRAGSRAQRFFFHGAQPPAVTSRLAASLGSTSSSSSPSAEAAAAWKRSSTPCASREVLAENVEEAADLNVARAEQLEEDDARGLLALGRQQGRICYGEEMRGVRLGFTAGRRSDSIKVGTI
jgi:hypothetical protein